MAPDDDPVVAVSFRLPSGGHIEVVARRGELLLLRGPNGSGKSTLLRQIAGLPTPYWPSAEFQSHTSKVTLATQDPRDGLVGLTVAGEFRMRDLHEIPAALEQLRDRDVATLSSGQARRTMIATAVAQDAPLLLLDEPTEGLDAEGQAWLLALVARSRETGAVIAVDHGGLLARQPHRVIEFGPQERRPFASIPKQTGAPILQASGVALRRGANEVVLPPITLGPGLHVLAGRNGAGKSTFLVRLAGLLESNGVSIHGSAPRPGQNVRLLLPHARDLFSTSAVQTEIAGVDSDFESLVPERLRDRHPLTLSGGEAQRVALCKTLGRHAALYLLDEPEAHLDDAGLVAMWDAVRKRASAGGCILVATHDEGLRAMADSTTYLEPT